MRTTTSILALLTSATLAMHANADGRLVVANDEWTLSDTGFQLQPESTAAYALNLAEYFVGPGETGNFLAYSTNFGVTQSALANVMTGAGHGWTVQIAGEVDLATLLTYDAVFMAGTSQPGDDMLADLPAYIDAGGSLYLCAGTGSATDETVQWNPFLAPYGLTFDSGYNGIQGSVAIESAHPLFNEVSELYQNNGLSIMETGNGPGVVIFATGDDGLYAVGDGDPGEPCPADLDDDGEVGGSDLGILLGAWGSDGPGDLDGDGDVGGSDLGILLGAWGACAAPSP